VSALGAVKAGDTVEVTIQRDSKTEKVKVKVEAPPGAAPVTPPAAGTPSPGMR
jgi:hypothetical protein